MAEVHGRGCHGGEIPPRNSLKVSLKFSIYPVHHVTTRYNIPYLIDKPGSGNNIHGEVYEVDEQMLKNLDILEDHPSYYQRRPEKVSLLTVGKTEGLCSNVKNQSSS